MRDPSQTATLSEIIDDMIENRLYGLNTTMPAKVISVDATTGLLTVEPSFQRMYFGDEKPTPIPPIQGVPLATMRAGKALISMPVKKGDRVSLWFSQRSLDNWKQSGATADPADPRLHDLTDAIAYPGVYPISENIKTDSDALQIKFGATKITLKEDTSLKMECSKAIISMTKEGKFKIGNGSVDLLTLLKDGLTEVKATATAITILTVPTGLGPSGVPANAASFTAVETKITKILELLTQIME